MINLRETLDEARAIAPPDLRNDVARLYNFALLAVQKTEGADGDVVAGLVEALDNTDPNRLPGAIERVNESVVACGHASLTDQTA